MRYQLLVLPILLSLWPTVTLLGSQGCEQSRSTWWGSYENKGCYCGPQLSNVTVTLPPGLRLEAVCGLHLRGDSIHTYDLSKEKVSLDTYTPEGSYPQGFIYLSGTMKEVVTGTVTVEENPSGKDLWFKAALDHERPLFWKHHLTSLDLGSDEHYKKLRAPKPDESQGKCQSAQAIIRIRNPIVLLGQTDEAGTDADFDVIRVSKYQPCVPNRDTLWR